MGRGPRNGTGTLETSSKLGRFQGSNRAVRQRCDEWGYDPRSPREMRHDVMRCDARPKPLVLPKIGVT